MNTQVADPALLVRQARIDLAALHRIAAGLGWSESVVNHMTFMPPGHDDRFLDMWYEDTVSSPLDEIQRLYDFVGVDLTAEARAEMARWRDMNRREARPTHQYTLEEYGFTEEGLKNTFREYRERYILSRRPG